MNNKFVLRKWVEIILIIIGLFMFLIIMSDCENTLIFLVTHFIASVILLLIGFIFATYGRRS